MNTPLASVIVPVYNVEAYLSQCIESICTQTYSNLEIILVDDGSTDSSGQLCDYFAQQDRRVCVIHQENSGVSAARNTGLKAAKGGYIYFLDSDDWAAPRMVEETISLMEREKYDACTWGHNIVTEDGESAYSGRWSETHFQFSSPEEKQRFLCRWLLSYRIDWSVWSEVFRRDIIERGGLRFAEDQQVAEDLDFVFRYLTNCQNLYYIPQPLYFYRQRKNSVMHSVNLEKLALDTLHMIRRQDITLTAQLLPRPFYAYSGTILTAFLSSMGHSMEIQTPKAILAQAVSFFQATAEWDYLLDQARLAVKNRSQIRHICGLRLGEQVNGFFHYILTGDPSIYIRAYWLQQHFLLLRGWKDRLLH